MATEGTDMKIIAQLLVAGTTGLNINDLHKKCQVCPADKKNFQSQLYEMHNTGRVLRLPGNNWALSDTATSAPLKTAGQTTEGGSVKTEANSDPVKVENGDESIDMQDWCSPRPKINLPGMPTFTSFKNSLQEYVQKVKAPVDLTYTTEKVENGHFAIAHFAPMAVKSTLVQPTTKDAQAQAALDALIQLGYLPADTVYVKPDNRKRKSTSTNGEGVAKKPAGETLMDDVMESPTTTYKSKLQVISQQHHLAAPVYETIQHANGFFSTVTFNGKKFKSASFETRKKLAEQAAAHMCLFLMKAVADVPIGYTPGQEAIGLDDVKSTISELRQQSEEPTFPAKSKLQEFCQKNKMVNPAYQTTVRADSSAISTVTVNGVNYTGDVSSNRKKAESSAAAKACKALLLGCFVVDNLVGIKTEPEEPVQQAA